MIYISSSWRNRQRVRVLAERLRALGFEVFDFTDPQNRQTEEIPPEKFPEQFDPLKHVYHRYLDRPELRAAVEENKGVLDRCDLVILLLPCGIDSTADWAYAVGKGKPSIVVGHPAAGERSPTHLWADHMVATEDDALQWMISRRVGKSFALRVLEGALTDGLEAVGLSSTAKNTGDGRPQ